jgi:hypothetical protein
MWRAFSTCGGFRIEPELKPLLPGKLCRNPGMSRGLDRARLLALYFQFAG